MFICIWCEEKNRGIGLNNKIPWIVKEDLQIFKEITTCNKVVMGKNTFFSLKKPLINRENIVISKTISNYRNNDFVLIKNIDSFIKKHKYSDEKIFIIGGKQIFDLFIEHSKILLVTKLNNEYFCDIYMDNSFKNFNLEKVTIFDEFIFKIYLNKQIYI